MANRYWVGGTGTWNTTNTTNWSTSSGGSGGASVPTSSDDVFFDANSGGAVCDLAFGATCQSLNTTGFTGSLGSPSAELVVWTGGAILGSGGTYTDLNLNIQGGTVTTNGKSLRSLSLQGVNNTANTSGNVTVISQLLIRTINYSASVASGSSNTAGSIFIWSNLGAVNLGTASFTTGNLTLRCGSGNISGGNFALNASPFVTINLEGSSNISLNSFTIGGTGVFAQLSFTKSGTGNWTNLPGTIQANQSISIVDGYLAANINSPSISLGNGASVFAINANSLYPTITIQAINSATAGYINSLTTGASQTSITLNSDISVGTLTIQGPSAKTYVRSGSIGVRRKITASSSFTLSNVIWRDIEAAGVIPFTGTGFVDEGNNLNITFPAAGSGFFFGSNF